MKKYRKIKARLIENGYEQTDVARWLGRSLSYVCQCLNKKNGGFNNREMLILMDRLGIPEDEWSRFFGAEERGEI